MKLMLRGEVNKNIKMITLLLTFLHPLRLVFCTSSAFLINHYDWTEHESSMSPSSLFDSLHETLFVFCRVMNTSTVAFSTKKFYRRYWKEWEDFVLRCGWKFPNSKHTFHIIRAVERMKIYVEFENKFRKFRVKNESFIIEGHRKYCFMKI